MMNISGLILLLVLVAGQAYARLGETLEEIEKRVGKLEFSEKDEYSDNHDYLYATANEVSGFTRITFTFYKKELWGQKTNKCIAVVYFADYKKTAINKRYTISDAEELVKRNYPNVEINEIGPRKDRLKPIGISDSYYNSWHARGEGGGMATLDIVEDIKRPWFSLKCRSREIQKNYLEKCEAKEQEKKKTYEKL
jgi:hypothetical protein